MLLLESGLANAYEVQKVCAEYMGTGKKYSVEANVLNGDELNTRTKSYLYGMFNKYVVIFWAQNEVSIIELDYAFDLTQFGTKGKDQNGYLWNVSTSTYCF